MTGLIVDLFAGVYVDRFWSRVDKTGECWLWKGGRQKRPDGSLSYGVFCVGKRRVLAHVYREHHDAKLGPERPEVAEAIIRANFESAEAVAA